MGFWGHRIAKAGDLEGSIKTWLAPDAVIGIIS
jgi:hypothetical protein